MTVTLTAGARWGECGSGPSSSAGVISPLQSRIESSYGHMHDGRRDGRASGPVVGVLLRWVAAVVAVGKPLHCSIRILLECWRLRLLLLRQVVVWALLGLV